jgi:hypothetical protein
MNGVKMVNVNQVSVFNSFSKNSYYYKPDNKKTIDKKGLYLNVNQDKLLYLGFFSVILGIIAGVSRYDDIITNKIKKNTKHPKSCAAGFGLAWCLKIMSVLLLSQVRYKKQDNYNHFS